MAPRKTRETAGAAEERIPQDITDISDSSQLLRYALAGQLDRLRTHGRVSQASIAEVARLRSNRVDAASALSHALRTGPSLEQLQKLDEVISALDPYLAGNGGLSSLCTRLSPERYDRVVIGHVPPHWTGKPLRNHRPCSELDVLAQASALLWAFMTEKRVDARSLEGVREGHSKEEMGLLVRRLILISVSPPTPRSSDAQMLLGGLAVYAFDLMRDLLDRAVRYLPLAFRVWQAITRLVRLGVTVGHADELTDWVQQLIGDCADLRVRSLYPGRSLDLGLALAVPAAWSPPGNDWVSEALLARARDRNATIRERGTAAMGLWQRAVEQDQHLAAAEKELRELIAEFKDPQSRPDAPAGLRWVAATLEHVIERQAAVCNDWPDVDEPWFRNVHSAADALNRLVIPDHLRIGTRNLFLHMILQNAGVHRRQAIETVVASGMTSPIARALIQLLRIEKSEAWLRIRAEVALGYLQRIDPWVEEDLIRACADSYRNLELAQLPEGKTLPRSHVTEVHAALFAVGDCFGVADAEDRATSARERLRPVLTELANLDKDRAWMLRRAARAAAYLLTVTAQPREGGQPDLSEVLLTQLAGHPDDVTARLSRWALSFRFAPDGAVRPLLDAAEHKLPEVPY